MKKRFSEICGVIAVIALTVCFMAVSVSAATVHTPVEMWSLSEPFVMPEEVVEEPIEDTSPTVLEMEDMPLGLGDGAVIAEEVDEDEFSTPVLELTQSEIDLIASVVKLEDGTGDFEGQMGVAKVIINRVLSDDFPDTVEAVLNQTGQFESVPSAYYVTADQTQYEAVYAALYDTTIPDGVVFFAQTPENSNVYGKLGGHWFCYAYTWE